MKNDKLKVACLLGVYDNPELDFPYYLVDSIILGYENEEKGLFTDVFTGKEYLNVLNASEFGLAIGYGMPLDLKSFNEEKTYTKNGKELTKRSNKLDKDKCLEYYKWMEKLVFIESEEYPLVGINIDEFEKKFNVKLNLSYVEEENKLINALVSGELSEEEFYQKLVSKYDTIPSRSEDIEKKLSKILDKPISEVVSKVKTSIINQDEAIKKIITSIYKYALFGKDMKSNILIYGPSGVGKTALINEISKLIDYPVHIEDMTSYTASGFQGASTEDILIHLYRNAGEDLTKAEHSILFLDEIDKKAGKDPQTSIANEDVLKSLLKIIEGGVFTVTLDAFGSTINFDTSNLLIIAGGAFTDLYNNQANEKKNVVGFNNEVNSIKEIQYGTELTIKDFEKFGMPLEFMGRFKTIIRMNTLRKEDLITILKSSNLSELKKYINCFKEKGINLNVPEEVYEKIANLASSYGTGARGLNLVVDKIFENVLYEVFDDSENLTEVNLGDNIVNDSKDFTLRKRI